MNTTHVHTVLLSHYSFEKIGGAERVALKMAYYLSVQKQYDVTVVCVHLPDKQKLMDFFGKSDFHQITFKQISTPTKFLNYLFRIAFFHRAVKAISPKYDVCISSYNEQDFGKQSLQYVHHPIFANRVILHKYEIITVKSFVDQHPFLSTFYLKLVDVVANANAVARRANTTLTNSHFMSSVLNECEFCNSQVIYPTFLDFTFPKEILSSKKNQVIYLGRIEADKKVLQLIDYFDAIRECDPDITFVILGLSQNAQYLNEVREKATSLGLQVRFEVNKSREDVLGLLKESRYFLNPKPFEHFGISTIEAMAAYCIPFLHASGGSLELVQHNELLFENIADFKAKFSTVHTDQTLYDDIIASNSASLHLHREEAFFNQFSIILDTFIRKLAVR
jgi:glycosyltransferase involved in cell wall biosynthesis